MIFWSCVEMIGLDIYILLYLLKNIYMYIVYLLFLIMYFYVIMKFKLWFYFCFEIVISMCKWRNECMNVEREDDIILVCFFFGIIKYIW